MGRPREMRGLITDDFIARLAQGDERVAALLGSIRSDLECYLRRRYG